MSITKSHSWATSVQAWSDINKTDLTCLLWSPFMRSYFIISSDMHREGCTLNNSSEKSNVDNLKVLSVLHNILTFVLRSKLFKILCNAPFLYFLIQFKYSEHTDFVNTYVYANIRKEIHFLKLIQHQKTQALESESGLMYRLFTVLKCQDCRKRHVSSEWPLLLV